MSKKLTTWEASCIITGYGLGAGVLSMPYMAARNGIFVSLGILVLSFLATYVLHLMIAELCLRAGEDMQIISVLSRFLFKGKIKQFLTILFFVLMAGVLSFNLATYISGAGEILTSYFPISPWAAKLLFYLVAAVVVWFGLKAVGVSEKITVTLIFGLIAVLAVASFFNIHHALPVKPGNYKEALAYFGTAMFAMSAFFSVPQVVEGLACDTKEIRKAVFTGIFNNFLLIVIISVCALISSTEVTEVSMIGWSNGIGVWAQIIGSIFTILAMLTTYWSLSLALTGILDEMLKLEYRVCWLLGTIPSLLLTMIRAAGFLELMRLCGGLIAIIIAFMIVPAFRNARKEAAAAPAILKNSGGNLTQVLIILAYLLMAVGSVVSV